MPVPTPFHERTTERCTSLLWKDWSGHYAVRSYDTNHEREYYALRYAAGLIDVSPLFKYEIRGRGAGELLSRVTVRDVRRLKPGRVTYLCWCDDDGKVLDDGTASRIGPEHYRLTANGSALAWLESNSRGLEVAVEDVSEQLGALALQGPNSRAILERVAGAEIGDLRFFRTRAATVDGHDVQISRTGYTGDLGYEIWVDREHAIPLWDAIVNAGVPFRLEPVGLDALDVTRLEAGFVLWGVDYFSSSQCPIASRKSTPHEIGLGWTVEIDRESFIGQAALRAEQERGSAWALVGLALDWDEFERLHTEVGLPPAVPSHAWRTAVPVFDQRGRQIGQATSGTWSPLLKQNLALATIPVALASPGTRLRIEVTVEYHRHQISAVVTPRPFFDPERKRA